MTSPAAAIAWELWRRNRWALATIVVGVPALVLLHLIAGGLGESVRIFELLFFLFAITSLFWSFCCVEIDARGRHAGFPSRMFTLPLRTATLAGLPMIYGALAVAAFYWLWSVLIYPSWGLNVPAAWTRIHILTLVAMTFSLQAIVWSFYRFPWIRLALVIVALVGLGVLGLVSPAQDFAKMSERAVVSTIAVVALLAFAGGIAGVARDRRGEWDGWTRRFLDRVLSALPGRRHPFSSSSDAQVWFEWRGKGLFLSAILALPMICSMMLWPLPTMLHFDATMSALAYVNLPIVALWTAWFIGMTLAKTDYWSRESELSPFVTARPMSCGDIVAAKVKTAALVLFIASVAFVVFAVPAFNVLHWLKEDPDLLVPSWSQFTRQNPELLLRITNPIVGLTAFMIIWMGMIDGLSLGLLGKKHSTIRTIARVTLFVGAIIFVQWFARRSGGVSVLLSWLPWLTALTVAWKVGSTAWFFTKARALFSHRQALAGAALWLATVCCVAGTARLLWTDFPPLNRVILFAAAFLMPGAALARCVAHLYRQRHG